MLAMNCYVKKTLCFLGAYFATFILVIIFRGYKEVVASGNSSLVPTDQIVVVWTIADRPKALYLSCRIYSVLRQILMASELRVFFVLITFVRILSNTF